MLSPAATHCREVRPPSLVFQDPLSGPLAVLDCLKDLPHYPLRVLIDDFWAGSVVAIFGGVAHRIAHRGETPLVDQVDYELKLIEALEVSHLRGIAGLGENLEARGDEVCHPSAQDDLLPEQFDKHEAVSITLEYAVDHYTAFAAANSLCNIYLTGKDAYIAWNEGDKVEAGVILGDVLLTEYMEWTQNPKAARNAYAVREGMWAAYYVYQYYEYTEGSRSSDPHAQRQALEARDMAIAHTINAAMAVNPLTLKIALATEATTAGLARIGIIDEQKSFGELVVIDAYLILNIAGITDRNPVVEKEKYKADEEAMDWLTDKLDACGDFCIYLGE